MSVTLEGLNPETYTIEKRQTTRTQTITPPSESKNKATAIPSVTELPKVARGTRLRYRLENQGESPLYYLIVGINSSGQAIAYVPPYEAT